MHRHFSSHGAKIPCAEIFQGHEKLFNGMRLFFIEHRLFATSAVSTFKVLKSGSSGTATDEGGSVAQPQRGTEVRWNGMRRFGCLVLLLLWLSLLSGHGFRREVTTAATNATSRDDDRRRWFGGTGVELYGGSEDRDRRWDVLFCRCWVVVAVGVMVSGSGSRQEKGDADDDDEQRRQRRKQAQSDTNNNNRARRLDSPG